jgi:hypothetical protein
MKKRVLSLIMVVAMLFSFAPAYAEEGEIIVTTELQPTLIAFSMPTEADVLLNPNESGELRVISSDIVIINNSTGPIKVLNVSNTVDETAETQFTLVAPDKYEDWTVLAKDISMSEIATAITVTEGFERLLTNETIWSTDINEEAVEIGEIDAGQSGILKSDVRFGNAIDRAMFTKFKVIMRIELA